MVVVLGSNLHARGHCGTHAPSSFRSTDTGDCFARKLEGIAMTRRRPGDDSERQKELEKLERGQQIATAVDAAINKKLSLYRALAIAFSAGLFIFVVGGITFKDNIVRPILEYLYPTAYIGAKVREDLLKDDDLVSKIVTEKRMAELAAQLKDLASHYVDSGYSKTFLFSKTDTGEDNVLMFYAQKNQRTSVELSASATSKKSGDTKLRIFVDDTQLTTDQLLPYSIANADVTDKLQFNRQPDGNLHIIKFQPIDLPPETRVSINCVVIVANAGRP
jgi:hypothetical protein